MTTRLPFSSPLLAALAGAAIAVSCADDTSVPMNDDASTGDDSPVGVNCTPGAEQGCMCLDGRAGTQVCGASGHELTSCVCGGPTDDSAGSETADTGDSSGEDTGPAGLCGNGDLDEGEQCDDDNAVHDDACSNDCILECAQHWEVIVEPEDSGSFGGAIATGPDGAVVVTGGVETDDGDDIWIASYDADGMESWSTSTDGGNGNDFGTAIAVDADGNILVVGTIRGADANDIWVGMLDAAGDALWSDVFDGPSSGADFGVSATFDGDGNPVVSGTVRIADGDTDLWLRKYDAAGTPQWTETYGGPGNGRFSLDDGGGVAVDAEGSIFVQYEEYVAFDRRDVHLLKVGPEGGTPLWDVVPLAGGPPHSHRAAGAALDADGNVVMGVNLDIVSSSWSFWLAKYDTDGNEAWVVDAEEIGLGRRHSIDALGISDDGRIGLMTTNDPEDGDTRPVIATLDARALGVECNAGFGLPLGSVSPVGGSVDAQGNIYGTGLTSISPGTQRRWISRFRGAATVR